MVVETIVPTFDYATGKISGKRYVKKLTDSFASTAVAGLVCFGSPFGAIATGAVALGAFKATHFGCGAITQRVLDLSDTQEEDDAYKYFEIPRKASNFNKKYTDKCYELCNKHHPKKGGEKERLDILQKNMLIIKKDRGESGKELFTLCDEIFDRYDSWWSFD